MRAPSRQEVRAFPSDTTPLLVLLAAMVLSNVVFTAIWLAGMEYGGATVGNVLIKLEIPLTPGLAGWAMAVWWRLRRSVPLTGTPFIEAAAVIGRLVAEARLTTRPDVRLGPALGRRAFVAGTGGRPLLLMGPELLGLCTAGEQGRAVFDAVVRHEIAHLRAKDLTGYQVVTVLRATIPPMGVFVLLAAWLQLHHEVSLGEFEIAVVCVAAQMLIAELVARSYLRAREHQADLHATQYGDFEGVLAAVGNAPAARSWLRRHPGGAARTSALTDPGRLLTTAPAQLLLGATAAGSALVTLHHLLRDADSPENSAILTGLLAGVPLVLFAALGIWRATWRATTAGERPRTLLSAAVLLAGVVLGGRIALFPVAIGDPGLPLSPPLLAAYAVASLLLCLWLTAMGRAWYRHDPRARKLRTFLAYAVPAAAFVGGWTFAVLWSWSGRLLDDSTDAARTIARDFAFGPVAVLVVLIIAATTLGPALTSRTPLVLAVVAVLAVSGGLFGLRDLVTTTHASTLEIREVLAASPDGCPVALPTPRPAPSEQRTACAANDSEKYDLGPAVLTGTDVLTAAAVAATGDFVVEVTLTPEGSTRWNTFTETLVNKRAAFLVDDLVRSAPTIYEPLRGSTFQISQSGMTRDTATGLADRIAGR